MAHKNIDERRECVKSLLDAGVEFTYSLKCNLAEKYGCTPSAIGADIITLTTTADALPTHRLHKWAGRVIERDGYVCQYCGRTVTLDLIVEHVVPKAWKGPTALHNLVVACRLCNIRKGRSVWVPRNLEAITAEYPEWRERVLELSASNPERNRRGRQPPAPK